MTTLESISRAAESDATRITGRVARYALAGVRIVNGSVALIAPSVIIGRFGESPARDSAAVYGLRMFGIRTVLIGADARWSRASSSTQATPQAPRRWVSAAGWDGAWASRSR